MPFLLTTNNLDNECKAESAAYYRVVDNETYLFLTPLLEQQYFLLPNTYFVYVLDMVSDSVAHVKFDDIEGYVNINKMQACYSTPNTPFPSEQHLNIMSVCNVVVYSAPTDESQYIGLIPFNATNIKYYGTITGKEAINGFGNIWHYVKFNSFEQGIISGYVYAALTNELVLAPTNEEIVVTQEQQSVDTSVLPISAEFENTDSLFIIIGLGVLALVLLYLLFKTDKRKKTKRAHALAQSHRDRLPYIAKHTENDEFDF